MNFKKGYSLIWILFGVSFAVASMFFINEFYTPKDSWVCVNNEWVKNGNPTTEKPQGKCGDIILGTDFIEKGNIVKKSGSSWFLVYEKPGAPALSTQLIFTSKSQCKMGLSVVSCEDALWSQGVRAGVEGVISGKSVRVLRLKIY